MILCLLFNTLCVFGLNYVYKYDYEFTCRVASLFHSLGSTIGSILFINNIVSYGLFREVIYYNLVFILTDTYLYLTNKISNIGIVEMMFHHLLFIIAIYVSDSKPYFYALGLLCEGSTIFLNTRWFAINGYYFKNINFHTLIFWISFLIFRIFNITYLTYTIYQNKDYNYLIIISLFLILNYRWFYLLSLKLLN
jgi:hypothetical protein